MAPEDVEIRRLIEATRRSLVPARFPPRRDLDVAGLEVGGGKGVALFRDAFWARQQRFACFVVRLDGGPAGVLAAHALKALLRAALRSYPADRALALSLDALRRTGLAPPDPDAALHVAAATLRTESGEVSFATTGTAAAVRLGGGLPAAEGRTRLDCGDYFWLSAGAAGCPAVDRDGGGHDATELVEKALAGAGGVAAIAVGLRRLREELVRTFTLANDVAGISPVLAEVADHLAARGVGPEALPGLDVALDEVLTNIVLYAYDDGMAHEILLDVSLAGGDLHIEVADDGTPFDPTAAAAADTAAEIDQRPVGGLGLHFVQAIFDAVSYRRAGGWNRLTLVKSVAAAASRSPVGGGAAG